MERMKPRASTPTTSPRAQQVKSRVRVSESGGPPVGTGVGELDGVGVMINWPTDAGTMFAGSSLEAEALPAMEKNRANARKIKVRKRRVLCNVCSCLAGKKYNTDSFFILNTQSVELLICQIEEVARIRR
jgi:hypothetical protein